MIDARILREEPDKVKAGIAAKNADPALVDAFLELDAKWREAVGQVEALRAEKKKLSDARDIEGGKKNKELLKESEEKVSTLEKEREVVWMKIPNIPADDVPRGKDESENKVIRAWGEPNKFDFEPKDHMALGTALGIIDTETAAKVSGSRFGYLKGDLALMEFAIIQHTFKTLTDPKIMGEIAESVESGYNPKPFVPVIPPVMIRPDVYERMARLEPKEERYYIPSDDMYLIGSAEHTLGPLHIDEIISEEKLPLRYVGFSVSFRREAGAAGKDTRGILRVHQFDKIEIESFTTAENGLKEQDFIVAVQEYLLQSLELPYRVVSICTGDMGGPDVRQIDMETWMPGQNRYRETHTSDYNGDYQSRRLATKVKRANGTELVHMNDATVFAIGRILIAILENNQTADGKVSIPEVIRPYLGGREFIG